MSILRKAGCPPELENQCWGPAEHWEFLYMPIDKYPSIFLISIIFTTILCLIIYLINRNKPDFSIKKFVKVCIFNFVLIFTLIFLFVLFIERSIMY